MHVVPVAAHLHIELALLEGAGLTPEVVWRDGPMAVIAARANTL
jgi:hypothetical protein